MTESNRPRETAAPTSDDAADTEAARRLARRRRRRDAIFGDALPEVTTDESDEGHTQLSQDWYSSQRPPHCE